MQKEKKENKQNREVKNVDVKQLNFSILWNL